MTTTVTMIVDFHVIISDIFIIVIGDAAAGGRTACVRGLLVKVVKM
jgi:hypothetical protein